MLKKTVTYEDYNGKSVTEDFYFNLTKAELIELEVSSEEGFAESLQKIVASNNGRLIIESFKKMILMSYGQKSEDGKRFIKNDQLRDEFVQTEAYAEIFMELSTDAGAAAAFVGGIVPTGLAAKLEVETPTDVSLPIKALPDVSEKTAEPFSELTDEQLRSMSTEEMRKYFRTH